MFSFFDKKHTVSLVIIILFDLLLTRLPLTSVFGFEYSALNSILLVAITGVLTISYMKNREDLIVCVKLLIIPKNMRENSVISLTNKLYS